MDNLDRVEAVAKAIAGTYYDWDDLSPVEKDSYRAQAKNAIQAAAHPVEEKGPRPGEASDRYNMDEAVVSAIALLICEGISVEDPSETIARNILVKFPLRARPQEEGKGAQP